MPASASASSSARVKRKSTAQPKFRIFVDPGKQGVATGSSKTPVPATPSHSEEKENVDPVTGLPLSTVFKPTKGKSKSCKISSTTAASASRTALALKSAAQSSVKKAPSTKGTKGLKDSTRQRSALSEKPKDDNIFSTSDDFFEMETPVWSPSADRRVKELTLIPLGDISEAFGCGPFADSSFDSVSTPVIASGRKRVRPLHLHFCPTILILLLP